MRVLKPIFALAALLTLCSCSLFTMSDEEWSELDYVTINCESQPDAGACGPTRPMRPGGYSR